MSGSAFAALFGVQYKAFAIWRRRRSESPQGHRKAYPPTGLVKVGAPQPKAALELERKRLVHLSSTENFQPSKRRKVLMN
jgi:hypothetical protein